MTIRDARARGRMESAARPPSFGEAYYGPRLAGLARRRSRDARLLVWWLAAMIVIGLVIILISA